MDGLAQDMRSTLPSVSSPASPAPIMSLGHPGGEADRSGQPPQQAPYAAGRICRGYAKYGVCNFPNICIYEHPTELHMPHMGYYPLPGHYMVPPMMSMMHAPLHDAARADVGPVSHENALSSSNDSTSAAGSGPVYEAVVTGASGPVCPDWMQRGNCPQGDACTLQHPPLSVRGSLSSTPTAQSPQLPLPAPASPAGAHPFMMQPPPLDMDPSMPFPGHMMGHPMMNMHMVPPGARMMGMVPPGAVPLPMPMPGMPHMHMSGGPPVSLPPPGSLEASLGPGYRRILCKNWDRDCRYAENCKFFHPPPELAAHYAMIVREHAPSQGPIMVHIPYSVRSAYHLPSRPQQQQEHHAPGSTPPGPYGGYGQRDRYNRPPRPQNKYYNNAGPNERYNNSGNNTHPSHHHTPHLNNNNTTTNETSFHAGQAHEDKPTIEGPLGPGGGGEDAYPPLPSAALASPAIPSVPVPSGDASTLPNGTSSSPSSIANTNISPRSAEAAKKKNRNRKKKPNTASPPTSASPSPIPPASSSSSPASAPPPSVGPRPTAPISSSLPAPASAVAAHTPHSKPPASYGAARPSGPLPTSYAQTTRTGHPSSSPSSAPSSAPSSSSSSPSPSSFRPPSAPSFASVSNPGYKSGGFGSAPTGVGRGAPSGRGRGSAAAPRH
eukprot:TRINITY_DN5017_c0_g1_i5.p1 TRINITY_DN5017_c0_g1~~TRINITY_DN5017_c0_g1_i5.p1  ORF type:complete len:662 (-),score=172.17 TRINITY_DN5017_c0_g1_i5:123-2108(-)